MAAGGVSHPLQHSCAKSPPIPLATSVSFISVFASSMVSPSFFACHHSPVCFRGKRCDGTFRSYSANVVTITIYSAAEHGHLLLLGVGLRLLLDASRGGWGRSLQGGRARNLYVHLRHIVGGWWLLGICGGGRGSILARRPLGVFLGRRSIFRRWGDFTRLLLRRRLRSRRCPVAAGAVVTGSGRRRRGGGLGTGRWLLLLAVAAGFRIARAAITHG